MQCSPLQLFATLLPMAVTNGKYTKNSVRGSCESETGGMFLIVIVISVPGGPDAGLTEMSGIPNPADCESNSCEKELGRFTNNMEARDKTAAIKSLFK